jgi:hypothetical protein
MGNDSGCRALGVVYLDLDSWILKVLVSTELAEVATLKVLVVAVDFSKVCSDLERLHVYLTYLLWKSSNCSEFEYLVRHSI